jgi:hypothetical protein
MIGNRRGSRDICIARSPDGGDTWSEMVTLFEGRYHCAPTPVVQKDGFVYRAFETCVGIRTEWKSLVVAGDVSKDLLDPASWRMSNQVSFPGVPAVLTQHRYAPSAADKVPHDSFLEGNVVNVRGELRVMLRTIIDGHTTAGLASVCRLDDDGREMDYRFVQFYRMPGAGCKSALSPWLRWNNDHSMQNRCAALDELASCMTIFPQSLVNVPAPSQRPLAELSRLQQALYRCQQELGDNGRPLVRYSGTEKAPACFNSAATSDAFLPHRPLTPRIYALDS